MSKLDYDVRLQRLLARYQEGRISRRTFLGLLGAAGVTAGLAGPFPGWLRAARAEVSQIRFDGWGGIVSEAFREYAFDPYTEATGIQVVDGTFGSEEEHFTNVRAAQEGEYNIHLSSGLTKYKQFTDAGYGASLDESRIPNLANVMEAMLTPFRAITPDGLAAVPYDYGTTGLAFNTNHVDEAEVREIGANILLKPELKGKISGFGDWQTRVWYGALQTGQDPNAVEDIEAIWEKIREGRDLVLKYYSSGAELMDLLAKEEVYVMDAWSGRIAGLQNQGHPVAFYNPPNGYGWMEDLFVMKGSPQPQTEELLNYMLEPAVAIAVAEGQNYPPALDPTKVELTETIHNLPAFDPTGTLDGLTFADPVFWTAHDAEWRKAWGRIEKGF